MGQLERRFGRAEAERCILQLHAVWVSHMHADHHGGLYPLLLRRQALLQQQHDSAQPGSDTADGREQATASAGGSAPAGVKPLLILGPFPLFRVLCQYSKILPLSFTFLPNHYFFSPSARPPPAEALAAYEAVKAAAGLSVLEPFPVQHVSNSSGLQVQSQSGWKAVFSGGSCTTLYCMSHSLLRSCSPDSTC
jgi:ribonuclease Z